MVVRIPSNYLRRITELLMDNETARWTAIVKVDQWFQQMRQCRGFAGPISHWWESSLLNCAAMADWRYEGILCGYVQLARRTGQQFWVERAVQAGDDVVAAQLPNGNYAHSAFQQGPIEAGTPHEAACDIGLLELADLLRERQDDRWYRFFATAERNIHSFLIGTLWNGTAFLDQAWNTIMVPNKNATSLEALLLYEKISGSDLEAYIDAAATFVLSAQVTAPGPTHGATIHLGTGIHRLAIPIYTARCAAALIRLYESRGHTRYLEGARVMGVFLERSLTNTGVLFGYYRDGSTIACPTWIAPAGDVLRALRALTRHGSDHSYAIGQLESWLLRQQSPSGGFPTARGLGRKGQTEPLDDLPDFRDVLPVVGWVDKTFRAIAEGISSHERYNVEAALSSSEVACRWKNMKVMFRETDKSFELREIRSDRTIYLWQKCENYPRVYHL